MGCHSLLQGIFLTQGLNPGLQQCMWTLYHLSHHGSPQFIIVHPTNSLIRDRSLDFLHGNLVRFWIGMQRMAARVPPGHPSEGRARREERFFDLDMFQLVKSGRGDWKTFQHWEKCPTHADRDYWEPVSNFWHDQLPRMNKKCQWCAWSER